MPCRYFEVLGAYSRRTELEVSRFSPALLTDYISLPILEPSFSLDLLFDIRAFLIKSQTFAFFILISCLTSSLMSSSNISPLIRSLTAFSRLYCSICFFLWLIRICRVNIWDSRRFEGAYCYNSYWSSPVIDGLNACAFSSWVNVCFIDCKLESSGLCWNVSVRGSGDLRHYCTLIYSSS